MWLGVAGFMPGTIIFICHLDCLAVLPGENLQELQAAPKRMSSSKFQTTKAFASIASLDWPFIVSSSFHPWLYLCPICFWGPGTPVAAPGLTSVRKSRSKKGCSPQAIGCCSWSLNETYLTSVTYIITSYHISMTWLFLISCALSPTNTQFKVQLRNPLLHFPDRELVKPDKPMLNPNSCAKMAGKTTGVSKVIRIYMEFCKIPLKTFCLKPWNYMHPLLGTPTWNFGTFTWNLLRTLKPEPLRGTMEPSRGTLTWNLGTSSNLHTKPPKPTWNLGTSWNPYFGFLLEPFGTFTWNPYSETRGTFTWNLVTSWNLYCNFGTFRNLYLEPLLGISEPCGTLWDDCPRVPQGLVWLRPYSFQLFGNKRFPTKTRKETRAELHLVSCWRIVPNMVCTWFGLGEVSTMQAPQCSL